MTHWLVFAFLVICVSVGFNVLAKLSDGLIHPLYAGVIVQVFALVTSIILFLSFNGMRYVELANNKAIVYSIIAGLIIGGINVSIFYMYKYGAPISVALPVTRLGVIVLALIVGVTIFSESLTPTKIAGIVLSFISIFLMVR